MCRLPFHISFGYSCKKLQLWGSPNIRSNSETLELPPKCFQPKSQIACHGLTKNVGPKKKRFQNQPKSSEGTPTEPNRLFFNQPMPMGGLPQVSRRLLGKIWILARFAKRTRIAAASTSSSFLSHLKCLMMLFLVARMTRLGF